MKIRKWQNGNLWKDRRKKRAKKIVTACKRSAKCWKMTVGQRIVEQCSNAFNVLVLAVIIIISTV